jgi:predicted DCC family thiol-disulfide oxidoreductase YuxK
LSFTSTTVQARYILAYDVDCDPCTKFRNLVDYLDKHDKIQFCSLADADQKGLLDKVPPQLRYKSFHLVLPSSQVKSGSEGVMELFSILPGSRIIYPVLQYFPGAKQLVRFVYLRLAKLRNNGSCSVNFKNRD